MSKLNKKTGGMHKAVQQDENAAIDERPFEILPGTTFTQVSEEDVDEVQLELDPITGQMRVVGQELQDAQKINRNPLNDALNELEDDEDNEVIQFGPLGHVGKKGVGAEFTKHLEEIAESGIKKRPRQQSEREEEWIANLVQKHGEDYSAMFRDKKLNPMQQSVGDLKKRIKKWNLKHQND
jgi:nucleolar protein 16